jgi:hypothetical protein
MSGEIESHCAMDLGEVIKLLFPVIMVTRPAVHEDHRERPVTGNLITNLDAVGRPDRADHPFDRLFRGLLAGSQADSEA